MQMFISTVHLKKKKNDYTLYVMHLFYYFDKGYFSISSNF